MVESIETIKEQKVAIYNDLLFEIAYELIIIQDQLKIKILDLIKKEYDTAENFEFEEVEEIVLTTLSKTKNEDLVKLKELFNIMNQIKQSYLKKNNEYLSRRKSEINNSN